MTLRRVVPSLALCLAVAAAAHADDKKYDLSKQEVWRAGDVRTVTSEQKQVQKVQVKMGDQVVQEQNEEIQARWIAVEKVLEADDAGKITRSRIHLAEWKHVKGEAEDSSLQGALLEMSGTGASRAWKLLSDAKPSDEAKAWLDQHYGKKESEGDFEKSIAPKTPVAVGESWEGDTSVLAKGLAEHFKSDAAKSKIHCTLVGVEGNVANVTVELEIALTGLIGPQGEIDVGEGAKFTMSADGHRGAEGRTWPSDWKGNTSVKAVAEQQGATINLDFTTENSESTVLSGSVPEPAVK